MLKFKQGKHKASLTLWGFVVASLATGFSRLLWTMIWLKFGEGTGKASVSSRPSTLFFCSLNSVFPQIPRVETSFLETSCQWNWGQLSQQRLRSLEVSEDCTSHATFILSPLPDLTQSEVHKCQRLASKLNGGDANFKLCFNRQIVLSELGYRRLNYNPFHSNEISSHSKKPPWTQVSSRLLFCIQKHLRSTFFITNSKIIQSFSIA